VFDSKLLHEAFFREGYLPSVVIAKCSRHGSVKDTGNVLPDGVFQFEAGFIHVIDIIRFGMSFRERTFDLLIIVGLI